MMRGFLVILCALSVIGLGFWVYDENYKTQQEIREVRALHSAIGAAHERLNVLNAEWAYLNRPDRLRDLADLNFDRLGLLPFMPAGFGRIDQISYPPEPLFDSIETFEVSASNTTSEDPL